MIVATLTILMLLFGGGGLEYYLTNLKDDVKEHVVRKENQERIIEASEQLSADLETLQADINDHLKELVQVHTDFHSEAVDFDAVANKLLLDHKGAQKLTLDARDAMHAEMTEEEWVSVFAE